MGSKVTSAPSACGSADRKGRTNCSNVWRVRAVSHLETGSACVDLKVSEPVDEAVLQVGVATANTHLLLSASHFSKTKNKSKFGEV